MEPLVSIGMAVRNCQRTIESATRSILCQTYQNFELLVLDDGSSDETLKKVRQFDDARIRIYCDGSHKGLASRLNEALDLSRGQYFARMDGDDLAYPNRLELQFDYMQKHRDIDLVGAQVIVFRGDGIAVGKRAFPEFHAQICTRPWDGFLMAHPTFFGKRKWFSRFRYSENLNRAQDQDLLLRAYKASRFANVQTPLLGYRGDLESIGSRLAKRWYVMRSMGEEFCRQGEYGFAARGVANHILKGGIDGLTWMAGLRRIQTSFQVSPMRDGEDSAWRDVWQLCHQTTPSR